MINPYHVSCVSCYQVATCFSFSLFSCICTVTRKEITAREWLAVALLIDKTSSPGSVWPQKTSALEWVQRAISKQQVYLVRPENILNLKSIEKRYHQTHWFPRHTLQTSTFHPVLPSWAALHAAATQGTAPASPAPPAAGAVLPSPGVDARLPALRPWQQGCGDPVDRPQMLQPADLLGILLGISSRDIMGYLGVQCQNP